MTRTEENLITAERFFRAHIRAMLLAVNAAKEEFPHGPGGSLLGGVLTNIGKESCAIDELFQHAKNLVKS